MKPRTLTGRITLLLGVATVLLLGAAAMLMDQLVDAEMQRRFDADLLAQAWSLSSLVDAERNADNPAARLPARMLTGYAQGAYAVHCDAGPSLTSDPAPGAYPADWPGHAVEGPAFSDLVEHGRRLRAIELAFISDAEAGQMDACRLVLMQPREAMDSILFAIDVVVVAVPLAALLLVLLLTPFLVRAGLGPLARLRAQMHAVGPQHPGNRLAPTGTHELEPMVASFNDVLARMDQVLARERRFTRALAHETRTRLAELHALVDVERRFPGGREMDEVLAEVGAIGADMESSVSGLLLLTRLDAGLERVERGNLDVAALLRRHLARVAPVVERRGLVVTIEPPTPDIGVAADAALMDLILGNLLANAAAYAPSGGTLRIAWDAAGIVLENPAPDLGPEDVAQLGSGYWSKQEGRDGHMGLGLALAGAAANAMDFALSFTLTAEGNLAAALRWRQAEPG